MGWVKTVLSLGKLGLAMQVNASLHSGEIDTEGSLADMVGGYTALEGRWSRGRQVQIL